MDLGLVGRSAVVTGGSKGLGLAIAAELVAEGARVAICSRHADELADAERGLKESGGQVFAAACDVTDQDQVTRFVDAVAKGEAVILAVPAGLTPTRVRYAWADSPIVNLYNRAGLPATPFEITLP